MPAAEDPEVNIRPCKVPEAADADCTGKSGNTAGAKSTTGPTRGCFQTATTAFLTRGTIRWHL
jgi:hypothetical protein